VAQTTSISGGISILFSLLISVYPFVNLVDAHAYAIKVVGTVLEQLCCAGVLLGEDEISRPSADCG
jgi:hypothetical protein